MVGSIIILIVCVDVQQITNDSCCKRHSYLICGKESNDILICNYLNRTVKRIRQICHSCACCINNSKTNINVVLPEIVLNIC